MSYRVNLYNLRPGILDLSSVTDAEGKSVVLQPKGHPGDWRECLYEATHHPDVETMLKAKWIRVEHASILVDGMTAADDLEFALQSVGAPGAEPPDADPEAPIEAPPHAPPEEPAPEVAPVEPPVEPPVEAAPEVAPVEPPVEPPVEAAPEAPAPEQTDEAHYQGKRRKNR